MKEFAAILSLALLGACAGNTPTSPEIDANTITFNNFEAGGGWSSDAGRNDPTLLDKGRAHSGQYAIKVDKDHEFSLTYDMALGRIRSQKFKTIHLEAWAFLPSDKATGVVVVQVMEPVSNKQVHGDGLNLGEVVKTYGEWVPVSKDFTLPDDITMMQHLRLSLWRSNASDVVLLDDVKLSIKE
ncbi:MAG: hypothetical protein EOO56_23665 [Hymenobacter sp.]|nr:MAG: hypothetical protein EOO56_23665 [Hymenobacter sp.]